MAGKDLQSGAQNSVAAMEHAGATRVSVSLDGKATSAGLTRGRLAETREEEEEEEEEEEYQEKEKMVLLAWMPEQ